jgi:hypothetical protein
VVSRPVALGIGRDGRAPAVAAVGVRREASTAGDPTGRRVLCDGLAVRARASQIAALRRAIAEPAPAGVPLSA